MVIFFICMKPNFQKINQKRVGFQVKAYQIGGPYTLNMLTLEEFIPPYSHKANSYKEVNDNLEKALVSEIEEQGSVTNGKRTIMMDVLARAALRREAIINSCYLIQKNYH